MGSHSNQLDMFSLLARLGYRKFSAWALKSNSNKSSFVFSIQFLQKRDFLITPCTSHIPGDTTKHGDEKIEIFQPVTFEV